MRTLGDILLLSSRFLGRRGVTPSRLDAEVLVGHALGLPRLQVYLQHERLLAEPELAAIRALLRRRAAREPVAHIVGNKEFYGISFRVRPRLMVPRPDTETLVDRSLDEIPIDRSDPLYVADVGCGTGCVGLVLARKRSCVRLYAVDLSPEALACTHDNARDLGVKDRVALIRGDGLDAIPEDRPVDLVVSNPPYIPTRTIGTLEPEVSLWEDRRALDGGPDGLDVIRRVLARSSVRARSGALVEIGHDQGPSALGIARDAGFSEIRLHADMAGRDRVLQARR
ncbi:MAG: peptide chain release factor N(5)-glutamine methyltransferase [Deltaproteobacteria bacterium]|nr:peptide chain release factor N(5)-glutamine methyltransferase [Deltaproteobacteria bacterium]